MRITAIRVLVLSLLLGLTGTAAFAQSQSGDKSNDSQSLIKAGGGESESAQPESMKFNTETTPPSTDQRPTLRFTDPGETPIGNKPPDFSDPAPEEAPFKTYLGYPKNQVGIFVLPMNFGSTWTFNGQSFNFATTTTGLGLFYRLAPTPLWNMELNYMHY